MKIYYYDNGEGSNPDKWSKNWGDIVAPTIIKHFSNSNNLVTTCKKIETPKIISIGSVMFAATYNDLIWGTGVIAETQRLRPLNQDNIFATRGPKTRQFLMNLGYSVPEIYGDPALLYPQIYNPEIKVTHEWGIIPHYIDVNHPMVQTLVKRGVKFIDICAGEKEFIDQLKSVKKVLSSSLHGLISADTYGIPNARINLTGKLAGGDFKFEDYALSVNRNHFRGVHLTADTNLDDIVLSENIDWDQKPLLDNAPWNHTVYKELFY